MIKKTLSIFLTIILLSNIVNALSINNNLSNDTIYVDDDNTSGPWDGSIEHPYKEIWRGVEGASENDKVFVFSGTYTYVDTTITIDKSITLEGENIDSTIIDGYNKKNIIDISADNVEISGFTIKNSGNGYSGISVSSDSNKIFNNIIKSCTKGIYIESYSKNNNIYDNEFLNCGIETSSLNNNDIYRNRINTIDIKYIL